MGARMHPYAALKKGWVGLLAHHRTLKRIPAGGLVETRPDTKRRRADGGCYSVIFSTKKGEIACTGSAVQSARATKKGLNG